MAATPLNDGDTENTISDVDLLHDAQDLSAALPGLMTAVDRVAHTVAQGIHGRRRAGVGETFWEFRAHREGDTASMIDWRKSARTERLYIREREWEAVNTIWLWVNPSLSMNFRSGLVDVTKRWRALVLCLATANLLVRGGERVGAFASTMSPSTSRYAVRRLAHYFLSNTKQDEIDGLPPRFRPQKYSSIVLFSDFFEPLEDLSARLTAVASRAVHGHLVQVVDPAEETLPYKGRTRFLSMRNDVSLTFGRVEDLRGHYQQNFQAHREALRELARRIGWTFTVHRTDAAPQTALLALYRQLADAIEPHATHVRSKTTMPVTGVS